MNDSLSTPSEPAASFQGWTEAAQRFLIGLEMDNSKSYFETNRELYAGAVRGPMEALLAELQPEFGPGNIFRINRDIRFSADKSPYKTHIGAWTGESGRGGYVQLSARGLYAAAGPYRMDPRSWGSSGTQWRTSKAGVSWRKSWLSGRRMDTR